MWIAVLLSLALGIWPPSAASAEDSVDSSQSATADAVGSPWSIDPEHRRFGEVPSSQGPRTIAGSHAAPANLVIMEYMGSTLWTGVIDVVVQGGFAYCSMIEGLAVLNVSDPSTPILVGQLFLPNTGKRQLVVRGDFVYLAGGYGGLQIVNISDPVHPVLVASLDTPDWAMDLELAGDYAYVSDFSRLLIFDISDPYAPLQVAQSGPIIARAYTAAVAGNYLYVAGGPNGFHIVDISDPAAPILVQTIKPFEFTELLEIGGDTLYVQNNSSYIYMWDITNPTVPQYLGSRAVATIPMEIKIVDAYYYGTYDDRFVVADVFNPPVLPDKDVVWDSLADARGLALADTLIYLCDGALGMKILKQQDPDLMPQRLGSYDTPDYSDRIALSGNYALVRNYRDFAPYRWGLQIVDISDPAAPLQIGTYYAPGKIYDAEWKDAYVYVADNNAGLQVLDVSDPGAPNLVHAVSNLFAYDLAVVDTLLYVANAQGLQIFAIGDPLSPVLLGTLGGFGAATAMAVAGNYAFLSAATTGFQIVDVFNPSSPVPLGSVPASGIKDIAIQGDIAYAVNVAGLRVFDCSDKSLPSQICSHPTQAQALSIEVRGSYAYVAEASLSWVDESGLWVYDISNPSAPAVAGFFHTPGVIWDVALAGSNLFVADFHGFLSLSGAFGTGDVTGDGKLTGADLVWLVNYLYKDGPEPMPNLYQGDVDCSGTVDLIDLIYLGNYIFRTGPAPC